MGPIGAGARLRRFQRLRLWGLDLARARGLRPAGARAALALLAQSLSGAGLTLSCPAPAGGGMGASFRLDGSATLRFTGVAALTASEGTEALARLGERMAAARDGLASIRAAIDALVGLSACAAALAASVIAGRAGSGEVAALFAALVPAAYAALIPCRRVLLRLVFRALMRAAQRRTGPLRRPGHEAGGAVARTSGTRAAIEKRIP